MIFAIVYSADDRRCDDRRRDDAAGSGGEVSLGAVSAQAHRMYQSRIFDVCNEVGGL
jgi:hypothetical protein